MSTPKTVDYGSRPTEISVVKNKLRPDCSEVAGQSVVEQWTRGLKEQVAARDACTRGSKQSERDGSWEWPIRSTTISF
jgi:hypothetical protein